MPDAPRDRTGRVTPNPDAGALARCVDCGGTGRPVRPKGGAVALLRCDACGLVFGGSWHDEYAPELYEYYADRWTWPEDRLYRSVNLARLAEVLSPLRRKVNGRRLLDVGCGEGTLVRAALAGGWDASGIDLAEGAIAIAQRFELPCFHTDFFDASLDGERYDLIVMSEFIEHVPQPTRFLQRARTMLSHGGAIYLTTPNFNSLGRRVLGADWRAIHPEHLSYFTPRRLRTAAVQAGLKVESMRTVNLSLATLRGLAGRGVPRDQAQSVRAAEQSYRESHSGARSFRWARSTVNVAMNITRLGEGMRVILRPAS